MNSRIFLIASVMFAGFLSTAAEDAPPQTDAKPGAGTTTTTQEAQNQTDRAKNNQKIPEGKNSNAVNSDETKNGADRKKTDADTKAPATSTTTQDTQRNTDRAPNSK